MKKIIITSIMALAAASAFAGSATAEFQSAEGQNGTASNTAMVLTVRENVTPSIVADLGGTNQTTDNTHALSTRLEVGGTYSLPLSVFTASARVGLGEKYTAGNHAQYWSIEPALAYQVNSHWSVKASYRYRTAVDSAIADKTNTTRVGATYALTKKDSIGVRYDVVRGDSELNVVALNYTRSF
jgi:opacity protein-like surface antigen